MCYLLLINYYSYASYDLTKMNKNFTDWTFAAFYVHMSRISHQRRRRRRRRFRHQEV